MEIWLLGAHAGGFVFFAVVLFEWLRIHPERRLTVAVAGLMASVLTIAIFALLAPARIPVRWVTVLHEGLTAQNIRHLYGVGVHAGWNMQAVIHAVADSNPPELRDVVRMNLWLAALNAALFAAIARHALRHWWSVALFSLAFVCNPLFSQLLTTYLLLAVPAAAILAEPVATHWGRVAAIALIATLTWLTGETRPELAAIGIVALVTAFIPAATHETLIRRLQGVASVCVRHLTLTVVATVIAGLILVFVPFPVPWVLGAVNPLNFGFLTLPGFLWLLGCPPGLIALVIFGTVHTLRHGRRFLWLPLSVLGLHRLYNNAASTFFESLRHLTVLGNALLLLALFGWRELETFAAVRGWSSTWRPRAALLLAVLMLTPAIPGFSDFFLPEGFHAFSWAAPPVLTRDVQIEVRYLLEQVDRHPDCVFVARTVRSGNVADLQEGPISEWDWTVFGRPIGGVRTIPAERPPDAATLGAQCVYFYHGLDCNLVQGDGCLAAEAGRRLVDEFVRESLRYNDPQEYGLYRGALRRALFEVAPPPMRQAVPGS
jgi:hypothetical protein